MARKRVPKVVHLIIFSVFDLEADRDDYALVTSRIMRIIPKAVKIAENAVLLPDNEFIKAEAAVLGILREGAEFLKFELKPTVTGVCAAELKRSLVRLGLDAYCTPA